MLSLQLHEGLLGHARARLGPHVRPEDDHLQLLVKAKRGPDPPETSKSGGPGPLGVICPVLFRGAYFHVRIVGSVKTDGLEFLSQS